MGEYSKGILGAFSGKVGPVVGANWRGKDIMRSLPKKSNRLPSELQLVQRQKFAFVTRFLTPINLLLGRYFGQKSGDRSKKNMALSYHLKEAVSYDGAVFEMIYNKVQVSKGDLLGLDAPEVVAATDAMIRFNWNDNSGQVTAKHDDQLIAVVYEEEMEESRMFFEIAPRSAGTGMIQLQDHFIGKNVHCWIAFVTADEKKYATSNYMGKVTVVA